jgi:hypothetical protein
MTAEQISISELLSLGTTPDAAEAVAVALALMRDRSSATSSSAPHEPLLPENVYLGSDGSVVCRGCGTPAVSDVALFLRQLLPIGTAGVPGGLHYTIARALQDVDAPAFDSAEDFSTALARFQHGDSTQFLCGLLERARANAGVTLHASTELASATSTAARRRRPWPGVAVAAWVTAASTLIASGEAIHRWLAVPPGTMVAREAQPHDVVLDPPVPEAPVVSMTQPMPGRTARATRPLPGKGVPRRASRSEPHGKRGFLERLHLHWLHRMFTRRA